MIEVYPDLETLSDAAAQLFAEQAERAIEARDRFSVALSGSNTPRHTYELLARPPFCELVPWAKVYVFWGDERCVPTDDPRSNYRLAREALLDHVPIPPGQIHPILCAAEPHKAAERYEAVLRASFTDRPPRFDLVYLGLGEDGHTASLFPGTPLLEERRRWVGEVYVAEQNLFRITLTALLFNCAAVVAYLLAGDSKAAVLREVLEGRQDPTRLPAQLIRPTDGELRWLVDRAAASQLTPKTIEQTIARSGRHVS